MCGPYSGTRPPTRRCPPVATCADTGRRTPFLLRGVGVILMPVLQDKAEKTEGARAALDAALAQFEERVKEHWEDHRRWKWRLRRIHYALGIAAAALGGAATVAALQEVAPSIVAILAALGGVLGAVTPFLRPADLLAFHVRQEIDYERILCALWDLRRTFQFDSVSEADAEAKLEALRHAFFEVKSRGVDLAKGSWSSEAS